MKDNNNNSFFKRPSDAQADTEREFSQDSNDFSREDSLIDRSPYRDDRGSSSERRPYNDRGGYSSERSSERGRDFAGDRRGGSSERDSYRGRDGANRPRGDFRTSTSKSYSKQADNAPMKVPENIIFGVHPIIEAIEIGAKLEKIYIRRSGDDRVSGNPRFSRDSSSQYATNSPQLEEIKALAEQHNIVVQQVPVEKLDQLSRRNNHQGVVGVTAAIEYADFNQLSEELSKMDKPALVLALDGVTDIRNFGAIARSAECAGVDAIIMSAKNSAPVNAEAIKSSSGALSIIKVCRVGSMRNSLRTLQMGGMELVAATEKSTTLLFESDLTKPTVIIMGGEERGISSEILKMCDKRISIPMLGKIESLNVSAAAAVILFEVLRQRFENS